MTTTEKTKYPMRDEYQTIGDRIRERTGQNELRTVADVLGGKIEFGYTEIGNRLVLDHFTHDGCTVLVTLNRTHDEYGDKLSTYCPDQHENNNCQVFIAKTTDIKNAFKAAAKERADDPEDAQYVVARIENGYRNWIDLGSYTVSQTDCRFCDWGDSEQWSGVCNYADDQGQYGSRHQISRGAQCHSMPWNNSRTDEFGNGLLDPFRYCNGGEWQDGTQSYCLEDRFGQVFGYNVQHMSRSNRLWFSEFTIKSHVGNCYSDNAVKRTVCPIIELTDESCIDDITIARDNWVDLNVALTDQWIALCKVDAKRKALSYIAEQKRIDAHELSQKAMENVSGATALDVLTTQLATVLPNFNLEPELKESDLLDKWGELDWETIESDGVKYNVTMKVSSKDIQFGIHGEVTPGHYPEVATSEYRSVGGGLKGVRRKDGSMHDHVRGRCLMSREHSSNKQCYDNGECRMSMAASFADTYDMGKGWGNPSRLREFACMMKTMVAMRDQDFTTCK
jgi:hypothetical protein